MNPWKRIKWIVGESRGIRAAKKKGMTKKMARAAKASAFSGKTGRTYFIVDKDGDVVVHASKETDADAVKWFTSTVRNASYPPHTLVVFDIVAKTKQVNEFQLEVHDDSILDNQDA